MPQSIRKWEGVHLTQQELMNVGANYLREHVADDVRMHYNLCSIRMVRLILYRHILQQIILSAQQSGREQKMHLRG